MTNKKLTFRQAKWAEFLFLYNLIITYKPGKEKKKADSLTSRPGDKLEHGEYNRQQAHNQVLLLASKWDPRISTFSKLRPIYSDGGNCRSIVYINQKSMNIDASVVLLVFLYMEIKSSIYI